MNRKTDELESFDFSDLTLVQPTISDNLLLSLEQPAISNGLMLEQPTISGNLSIDLEQPAIGDDLTQEFIHHLMPPEKNNNSET